MSLAKKEDRDFYNIAFFMEHAVLNEWNDFLEEASRINPYLLKLKNSHGLGLMHLAVESRNSKTIEKLHELDPTLIHDDRYKQIGRREAVTPILLAVDDRDRDIINLVSRLDVDTRRKNLKKETIQNPQG